MFRDLKDSGELAFESTCFGGQLSDRYLDVSEVISFLGHVFIPSILVFFDVLLLPQLSKFFLPLDCR
jgi:hypothetical protein